ncbi:hypothetical protein [Bradyrhizobium sp. 25ACV]
MKTTLTANGTTSPTFWPGGSGTFSATGTFGGGTAKLQMSPNNGVTWIDVDRNGDTYVTFTANGQGGFELAPCLLRVSLTGATSPSLSFKANRS